MIKQAVHTYIEAYNAKNVPTMLALLDDNILFENISNTAGIVCTTTKQEFEALAVQSLPYFSERRQIIRFSVMNTDAAVVEIDYRATVGHDLPNGLKRGDHLQLRGVSVFEMKQGKFTRISDYS